MAKKFTYKGKTIEEMQKMSLSELAKIFPARQRRSLTRGFNDQEKLLLLKVKKFKEGRTKKPVKTQVRDMIVLPEMVGLTIHIYNGKEYIPTLIAEDMVGHYLGEFAATRKKVAHSAPGIGATRSSASASVK
ncbi:MAG: 30S ribosomal protein S19 [Candidatus Nanoarchaeia archaeon]|nr:30S ribosomal protein S19 [Candidatus Nanoarchaeia archaeon]MDD5587734.1 30S ribosomal protein S19 [Candidatus Nanoarchaeia archaeon]